jgi:hypothetical protein
MDERKFTHYAYGAEDSGCDPQLAERYLETPSGRCLSSARNVCCDTWHSANGSLILAGQRTDQRTQILRVEA